MKHNATQTMLTSQGQETTTQVCTSCGQATKTYQQGKCKPCLMPELKRASELINRYRGGA